MGVEATAPMVGPAGGRAVSVETPADEDAAVAVVSAGVAVPASGGVRVLGALPPRPKPVQSPQTRFRTGSPLGSPDFAKWKSFVSG